MAEAPRTDNRKKLPTFPSLSALLGKKTFVRTNKQCPLSGKNAPKVDYKNIALLKKFISERGKMLPSRITSVSLKKQRELAKAVKRARFLALLPYVDK
ncbi:MAG: 30S ribosomal protein S18 [Alphaproteobacteria bacterium CG11_big_fil_rev_8_21_14_0_20_44_7]|nr:MAG: 30S ribosomal protein S18 [Alphaproteobacteria bacterium CG11_big_fil_rev_8_21_14_0_20_44_7]